MGKPMSYCRAYNKDKYEEYSNAMFTRNVVSNSEIIGCIFQFKDFFFRYSLRTSRTLQISFSVKDGYIGIEIVLLQAVSVFGYPLTWRYLWIGLKTGRAQVTPLSEKKLSAFETLPCI